MEIPRLLSYVWKLLYLPDRSVKNILKIVHCEYEGQLSCVTRKPVKQREPFFLLLITCISFVSV